MKFYRVAQGKLVTLRVNICQRYGPYATFYGKTRRDACELARTGGFYRTLREALRA